MSVYLSFDDEPVPEQAATNKGWGDFCRWAGTLHAEAAPAVLHLAGHGWENDLPALTHQLTAALHLSPPSRPDVGDTARGVLDLLRTHAAATFVTVTNGLSAG